MSTILLIDPAAESRAEIRRILDAAKLCQQLLESGDGMQGLELLLGEPVDLVLCDVGTPGLDAEKLLCAGRANPAGNGPPFVFLTPRADSSRRARLIEQGAADALARPYHAAELVARVGFHLRHKRLREDLLDQNARLSRLTMVDEVSGLRSRRYVQEVLHVEFLRARRYGHPLGVLLADIDNFKDVNDSWGHAVGDRVLREVCRCLEGRMRASDTAGRWGGDELLIVAPHADAKGAAVLGERWRAAVETARIRVPDDEAIAVTLSVGTAQCTPEMETPEAMIEAADRALYRAKSAGRNRVDPEG